MAVKTVGHVFVASSLILVALFAGVGSRSVTPALALTTTTINFDNLSPGTVVSTQYDAQGVDFEKGIVGLNVYCDPVITQVSSQDAESGDQVADTSCANGEFPNSSIRGVLKNSAQHLSVYAGFFPNWTSPPASQDVTITAYDIDGNPLGTDTETVPTGQGTHTLLQIASTSANIVQFDVTASEPTVAIDNLTFDNPSGIPPDFRIRPESSEAAVAQGSSTKDVIDVNRENGSTGGITFSASGLLAGVQASFSANPATGNSTTLTITAASNAALTTTYPYPPITVKGTPDSSSAGPAARSQTIALDVYPNFTVSIPSAVQVPPCSQVGVPVTVTWSANPITFKVGFTSDVSLAVSGLPADDHASFSPTTVSFPTNGTEDARSILTLSSDSDFTGPSGTITVKGTSGQFSYSDTGNVSRVPPSITSVSPDGGQTPQALQGGSDVIVTGKGLCPGTQQLAFGNEKAVITPVPVSPGGTQLQAIVPRHAATGKVYAIPAGGTINSPTTAVSPLDFNVDNYRDSNGFSFDNSPDFQSHVGGYSFSDVSDVFGYDQTHVGINPCWPFGNCEFYTPIPDPFALLFWGIANSALRDGQCFGFSLASQRLLHGDQAYSAFPLQPGAAYKTVWNLDGPDSGDGPSGDVAHFIHLMHMEQLSAEALHFWASNAIVNAVSGSQGSIIGEVSSALQSNDHPLIEIRNGTEGHVVVAYDVEDGDNGDKLIDVYDPNQEFTTSEDQDTSGNVHQSILSSSQIVVHSDGHWTFQGNFNDSPWHGGPGSLVVVPYGTVPVHPTLPTTIAGLVDLLFGSAHISQVTDASGHTLLNSDGSLNTNSKTRIASATQFATLAGSSKPGPDVFLFGKQGAYTQIIVGGKAGQYHDSLLGHGVAATLAAASNSGSVDKISLLPNVAGLQFGRVKGAKAGTSRQVATQLLVHASDGSKRTATVDTTMPTAGQDSVSFDSSNDTVSVRGSKQHAAYSLTLTLAGSNGLPQTFVTPKLSISAGETAAFTPLSWSSLGSQKLGLKVTHSNGTVTTSAVKNTIRSGVSFSVGLKVAVTKANRRLLTINATLKKLVKGSSAVFAWEVFHGTALVGHHTVTVSGKKLHVGTIYREFGYATKPHFKYRFSGTVTLLSSNNDGAYSSQAHTVQKPFHG